MIVFAVVADFSAIRFSLERVVLDLLFINQTLDNAWALTRDLKGGGKILAGEAMTAIDVQHVHQFVGVKPGKACR